MKIENILGKKGKCADCGRRGTWIFEPFEYEVHDEEYLICLCEDCEHERREYI